MTGYVVIFEGDAASGYSAYSPDVPGVVAEGRAATKRSSSCETPWPRT